MSQRTCKEDSNYVSCKTGLKKLSSELSSSLMRHLMEKNITIVVTTILKDLQRVFKSKT